MIGYNIRHVRNPTFPISNVMAIISGIPVHQFMTNSMKSGEKIICEWFNEPIYNDIGDVDFVLSIVRDITENRKKENS